MRIQQAACLAATCLALAAGIGCTTLGGQRLESKELAGSGALIERQAEMQRAVRDMGHFQTTLQKLILRNDSRGFSAFDKFLDGYITQHLEVILDKATQSSEKELMALDAGLRFQLVDALLLMRYPRRVERQILEIERLYTNHPKLRIQTPAGHHTTVQQALTAYHERKLTG